MVMKKHIHKGMPKSQKEQKNRQASQSSGKRSTKHVVYSHKNKTMNITPDASESLTNVYETHPSNKVGGIRRNFAKGPNDGTY